MGSLVGERGTVTVATRGPDGPGEVSITVGGESQTYIAHSDVPLPRHTPVTVYEDRGGRHVDVAAVYGVKGAV